MMNKACVVCKNIQFGLGGTISRLHYLGNTNINC